MHSVYQQISRFCTESGSPPPPHITDMLAQGESVQLECPICFEDIRPDTLVLSQCIHWYCIDCYESVAKRQNSCSLCRAPFYESVTKKYFPSVYQAALDLLQTVELTSGREQRLAITRLFRYLEIHPEIFWQNMLLQKIVLQKTDEVSKKAGVLGDVDLLAACTDIRRVLYSLSTA